MVALQKKLFERLKSDPLLRNSIYLMLSTGVMALFGFVFWLLVAHFYKPEQVGVASALISSMSFISYLSLLGFNSTFIRYLPKSDNRNEQINTGLVLVGASAILASSTYVIFAPLFAPRLGFLHSEIFFGAGFVLLSLGAAVNLVTDSIYIAYRSAGYNLMIDGFIASSIQLALPILLVGLGTFGIYAAQGSAAFVAMICSLVFLVLRFNYRPRFKIDRMTLGKVLHYSSGSYVANLLNILPVVVVPIIVLNTLGPASAGYYYLAFMMANLLFTVAYAVSQSLFAEGSHDDSVLKPLMKRSAAILIAIMVPSSIIFALAGPFVLRLFGASYAVNASGVIFVLAVTGPVVAAYILGGVMLQIMRKIRLRIIANVIYVVAICGLVFVWAPRGLPWVAGAWLVGNAVSALVIFVTLEWQRRGQISRRTTVLAVSK